MRICFLPSTKCILGIKFRLSELVTNAFARGTGSPQKPIYISFSLAFSMWDREAEGIPC